MRKLLASGRLDESSYVNDSKMLLIFIFNFFKVMVKSMGGYKLFNYFFSNWRCLSILAGIRVKTTKSGYNIYASNF